MKFKVTVLEHLNYEVEVEPPDEDAAIRVAQEIVEAREQPDRAFVEAIDVEPA
jgi:hypothetical protein